MGMKKQLEQLVVESVSDNPDVLYQSKIPAGFMLSIIATTTISIIVFAIFYFFRDTQQDSVITAYFINWIFFVAIVAALILFFSSIINRLHQELIVEKNKFNFIAVHDPLTELPNRKYYAESLKTSIALAGRNNSKVCIGLIDLNEFKTVNDEISHDAGDVVLKTLAERLKTNLRKSDVLARVGEDEFAVILPLTGRSESLDVVCNKILETVKQPIPLDLKDKPSSVNITASVGIAVYPDDSTIDDELRAMADYAMHHAKAKNLGWIGFKSIEA